MNAVVQLQELGYALDVAGGKLRFHFAGDGQPDPAIAAPLLAELRDSKAEAVAYLELRKSMSKPCGCGFSKWWINGAGQPVCGVCHPPAENARRLG